MASITNMDCLKDILSVEVGTAVSRHTSLWLNPTEQIVNPELSHAVLGACHLTSWAYWVPA